MNLGHPGAGITAAVTPLLLLTLQGIIQAD